MSNCAKLLYLAMAVLVGILHGAPSVAQVETKLIHFTVDGTTRTDLLLPDFTHHSVWSGLGQSNDGTLYVAVSDHKERAGNVAIFALDPEADRFRVLGDLRSVSKQAGNWEEDEGQYKVHSFLKQHSDGMLYFATMPSSKPERDRGGRIYSLDPNADVITDVSARGKFTMRRDGSVVPGTGVTVEGQGIKGLGLTPNLPDLLYLMTHDRGQLLKYNLRTGKMSEIGRSQRVAYVFHVANDGDVYYLGNSSDAAQSFLHYDFQTGVTSEVFGGVDPKDEVGMIARTSNPDVILVLLSKSKRVVPVHTGQNKVLRGGNTCGKNWWQLFNMTVSRDGRHIFFVSNNNDHSKIWRTPSGGGGCQLIADVNELLGSRNLAFGGQSLWQGNSFFTPVWTHNGDNDLAILKVTLP